MSEIESRIKKLEAKLQPGWVFALFDDAVVLLSNGEVMDLAEFEAKYPPESYLVIKRLSGFLLEEI